MNTLHKNTLQSDCFSDNFITFEKDFYKYANINIPPAFLTDDILEGITSIKNNYFRANAKNYKDNPDHYFIFRENSVRENKSTILFQYVGYKSQTELKNLRDNR